MAARLAFLGDIMLGRLIYKKFSKREYQLVGPDIINYCKEHDFVIANLESPLVDSLPVSDDHLVFQGGSKIIEQFSWIDLFSISNNHINDCGSVGMAETVDILEKKGYRHNGLFINSYEPFKCNVNGEKVAFITCTDMMNVEFSKDAPYKTLRVPSDEILKIIEKTKKEGYFVVFYAHVGLLFSRFPNPVIRDFLIKSCDYGADLVVTVHPHVLGGMEIYKNSTLVYSLGDFVMDGSSYRRRTSGILTIEIDKGVIKDLQVKIAQTNKDLQTNFLDNKKALKYHKSLKYVSEKIHRKRFAYVKAFKHQYKFELLHHSASTLQYLYDSKGLIGMLKIVNTRINAVIAILKRTFSDRSKLSYDHDAVDNSGKVKIDDL